MVDRVLGHYEIEAGIFRGRLFAGFDRAFVGLRDGAERIDRSKSQLWLYVAAGIGARA